MYKYLLISKYLTRKLAPLSAALAVTLCTAMVIVVISIMGGFLDMLRDSAKNITGDLVLMSYGLQGFEHYEDLIARLQALPGVEVAMPVVESYGLINFGDDAIPVQIRGVDFNKLDQINGFRSSLEWDNAQVRERLAEMGLSSLGDTAPIADPFSHDFQGEAAPDALLPMVIGIEVNPYHRRDDQGNYDMRNAWVGGRTTLTVVPLSERGTIGAYEPTRQRFIVSNEFKSGLYDVDRQTVTVPFHVLQRMLQMQARTTTQGFDPLTGEGGKTTQLPGRANQIVIRLAPTVALADGAALVENELIAYQKQHRDRAVPRVLTWEQVHGQLIGAVQNEKGMVTFLFIVISAVAVVMVATTFFVIVQQKTRDIGILRAIGASRLGVLMLFLGYGLSIGVIGGTLGLLGAVLLVNNLNTVQTFLASSLGVTAMLLAPPIVGAIVGAAIAVLIGFVQQRMLWWLARLVPVCIVLCLVPAALSLLLIDGWASWLNTNIRFVMWDPQTYFFDRIPGRVDPFEALPIVAGAVLSSVLGAVVPALVASAKRPVDALRYE